MEKFNPSQYTTNGTKTDTVVYSDITTNITRHPGTKDITRLTDVDAVKNSIRNILKTNRYERLYKPQFGANLNAMLFELMDESSTALIKTMIETAVTNFEPRARVLDVNVIGLVDGNTLAITIVFSLINNPEPQTLDLKLTRVR